MSEGAVTLLYTGNANIVRNTAPCDIAKWSLLFYKHDQKQTKQNQIDQDGLFYGLALISPRPPRCIALEGHPWWDTEVRYIHTLDICLLVGIVHQYGEQRVCDVISGWGSWKSDNIWHWGKDF